MSSFSRFLKAHTLWVGFMAVVVPLGVLLVLQYVWLGKLEQASAIAHQAALRNYLDAVATEVEWFYRSTAERALSVPSSPFDEKDLQEIANYWKKKSTDGARSLFLVDYTRVPTGNFYIYERKTNQLQPTPASEESLAVVIACLPWQTRVRESVKAESAGILVNEQDPANRIILSPVTDDQSRVVGIAALVLDEQYFRDKLLPKVFEKARPSYFPQEAREDLLVTVRNQEQNIVMGKTAGPGKNPAVTQRFPFVFTDWTMSLHSVGSTPEQLARGSFMFNMTLAMLLAVVLLGGIIWALRAANRAMRLSEMKSDFVSNVSHELRTPLASVRVFAEHLRAGRATTPEKVQEYGEYIDVESHRLSRLIDNILDFSRIETDRKTYRFASSDLREVVESVMKSFSIRLKKGSFQVSLELPEESLEQVQIDADAISQALHNLLDNAVKYSQDSKNISVRLYPEDGFQIVSVRDQGIGIPRNEQARIFERFHRVGTSLVHDIKGNGLGLSIVMHIVRAHSGSVTVESEPGKGSTFFIRLPAKPRAQ